MLSIAALFPDNTDSFTDYSCATPLTTNLASVHHVDRRFPRKKIGNRANRTGPKLLACFF
jgi:hypothetical protein